MPDFSPFTRPNAHKEAPMRIILSGLALLFALVAVAQAQISEHHLTIARQAVAISGKASEKITVNGTIPGQTLRFSEGDEAVIHVTNRMDRTTSIHWHGLLLPDAMDGVPGFGGFPGIAPGETFTYRFTIRQNGTYWYHAHSSAQEQDGLYGALITQPYLEGELYAQDVREKKHRHRPRRVRNRPSDPL
jgi:FtsP/CotA-like multicopper oxidase with cupredoxin domain